MLKNITTKDSNGNNRVNFDICCDVCGEQPCVYGEENKTFCYKHKSKDKRIFIESKEEPLKEIPAKEILKTYDDGKKDARKEILEKLKTIDGETLNLEEARIYSKALSKVIKWIETA